MKSLRILLSFALLSLSAMAFAQPDAHQHAAPSDPQKSDSPKSDSPKSEAQKSFDQLKALAGTWHAKVTTDPPMKSMGDGAVADVSLRVTSRGNALVHEMGETGKDDPMKYDHPVTMFYLDGDRLLLTHYCDAGNRPRMAARVSPDGKTVEFDFLDVAGNTQYGNMYHALFTFIDADHHTEDWTFKVKGDKLMHAHMDLQRVKQQVASAR
ncbi:MAG TPA: hypothetical protein VGK22_03390 [Candidatus Angelobacter sp.]